jgi:hypothetical protein
LVFDDPDSTLESLQCVRDNRCEIDDVQRFPAAPEGYRPATRYCDGSVAGTVLSRPEFFKDEIKRRVWTLASFALMVLVRSVTIRRGETSAQPTMYRTRRTRIFLDPMEQDLLRTSLEGKSDRQAPGGS